MQKEPTIGSGKICYLQIPATDINRSMEFYRNVFGWHIRHRDDGRIAFDDGVQEVSGEWVLHRSPMREVGLLVYIMVDNIEKTIDKIHANGGEIVQPVGADEPEITAQFRDPAGNILGIFQERSHTV